MVIVYQRGKLALRTDVPIVLGSVSEVLIDKSREARSARVCSCLPDLDKNVQVVGRRRARGRDHANLDEVRHAREVKVRPW